MELETVGYEEFLAWVRAVVDRAGNQAAVCREIGVHPAYLSDILRRERMPSDEFLKRLKAERVHTFRVPRPKDVV